MRLIACVMTCLVPILPAAAQMAPQTSSDRQAYCVNRSADFYFLIQVRRSSEKRSAKEHDFVAQRSSPRRRSAWARSRGRASQIQ